MESWTGAGGTPPSAPTAAAGGTPPPSSQAPESSGPSAAAQRARGPKCIACQNAGVKCSRTTPVRARLMLNCVRTAKKVDLGRPSTRLLGKTPLGRRAAATSRFLTRFSRHITPTVHQVRDRGCPGGLGRCRPRLVVGPCLPGGPQYAEPRGCGRPRAQGAHRPPAGPRGARGMHEHDHGMSADRPWPWLDAG